MSTSSIVLRRPDGLGEGRHRCGVAHALAWKKRREGTSTWPMLTREHHTRSGIVSIDEIEGSVQPAH